MMLSTALSEMMDRTECIIFFNTPSSIDMSNELNAIKKKEKTISPWIYHELMMTVLLRSNPPKRAEILIEKFSLQHNQSAEPLKIGYDVSKVLNLMPQLSDDDLMLWYNQWLNTRDGNNSHALDVLYGIAFPKQLKP